ncbi:NAD(P)H azoreductase [anaerobic digester metagenome]
MILITGANGQVGRAIIKALLSKGEQVRAFVFRNEHVQEIKKLGDMDVVVGNMLNQEDLDRAFSGVNRVYHICSAINPDEVLIGEMVINAARKANVKHFVFHSVLHSVLQEMPHHQKKLIVEQLVVDSGIPYTIVQPTVFMQNIFESWNSIVEKGVFVQKFFTTPNTRMCLVDLDDVAEAAAIILTSSDHFNASYEFSGSENLSLQDMVEVMGQCLNREIKVETLSDEMLSSQLRKFGADDYRVNTLLKMFHHYNEHGFYGNPNILKWMIGRKPNDFITFFKRALEASK